MVDLVDSEEIKKRWKENMKELYRKDLKEPDYYGGVISHPEPDILECKVKWALRRTTVNKASGCDEIPAEVLKSVKEDAIMVFDSSCQQIWKTHSGHRTSSASAQSCPTLCDPMNCSPPGSSVHGILQARILEWIAIPFSRDLPDPGVELGAPALQEDPLPSEV